MLVFPELSLIGYDFGFASAVAMGPEDPRLGRLIRASRSNKVTVMAGAAVQGEERPCIGAFIFSPTGEVATCTKEFLHPGEEVAYQPGRGGPPVLLGGESIALAICADTAHPEHAQAAAARGATIYAAGSLITPEGYAKDASRLHAYARKHSMLVLLANHVGSSGGLIAAGRSAVWEAGGDLLTEGPTETEVMVIRKRTREGWAASVLEVA